MPRRPARQSCSWAAVSRAVSFRPEAREKLRRLPSVSMYSTSSSAMRCSSPSHGSRSHVRSCRSGDDRSGKLGRHSAGAYIASCGGFAKLTHIVIHVFYNVDKLCIRIGIGIVCKKTVNIGHEDQKIRIDQCSNHRGKGIVVSEFYQVLEFVGGYRVVLIYNRDHLFCQKLLEGILGIPAVGIVDHGILGHQDLCHHLIVFPEKLLINGH